MPQPPKLRTKGDPMTDDGLKNEPSLLTEFQTLIQMSGGRSAVRELDAH